jgi:integrase/recombinase XerD
MDENIKLRNMILIEDFAISKATENTVKNYKSDLKLFSEFVDKNLLDVVVADVSRYMISIKNLAPSTKNRRLSCITDFYDYYIYTDDYVKKNPTGRAERFPVDKVSKTEPLEIEQSTELINFIKTKIKNTKGNFSRNLEKRNLAIVHIDLNGGFRIEEILGLKFVDLNLENGTIKVNKINAKGKKDREVNLPDTTVEYIKNYLEVRNEILKNKDSEYVFVNRHGEKLETDGFDKILKRYGNELGIDLHSHVFRHTYITNGYEVCHDIVKMQEDVGHSDISTTRRYLKNKNKHNIANELPTASL